jgi:hypothetical protein
VSDEPSEPAGRTRSPIADRSGSAPARLSAVFGAQGRLRRGRRRAAAALAVAGLALGVVTVGDFRADDSDADVVAASSQTSAADVGADPESTRDRAGDPVALDAASGVISRSGDRPALNRSGSSRSVDSDRPRSSASRGGDARVALPPDRRGAEAGVSGSASVEAPADPRDIARAMLARHGWSSSQFSCLDALWIGESNWDPLAENPTSGAYGIPQSLPAEKMAAAGPDWRTNPVTQIEWGLSYIAAVYGSPCAANSFKMANNWY